MIVCHCQGISDREIRHAVRRGAAHVDDVARACGAGSVCGGCAPLVAEIIASEGAAAHAAPVHAGERGVAAR